MSEAALRPSIKGQNCVTTLLELRDSLGENGYARFLSILPSSARAHAERRILSVEWVALEEWKPIEDAILSEICRGDLGAYRDLTHRIVAREFNSIYRFFLKVPSAAFVVQKFTRIYGTYYNCGRLLLKRFEERPTRARPTLIELEFPMRLPWLSAGLLGAYDAILALIRSQEPAAWIVEERLEASSSFVSFAVTY